MNRMLSSSIRYSRDLAADFASGWNRFWFTPADPVNLGAIRIVTGLVLLWVHLTTLPDLMHFIGPHALLDQQAIREMSALPFDPTDAGAGPLRSGDQSIWFYIQQPSLIWTLHGVFLIAALCFTLGWFSRIASVIVWIGHVSYVQRGGIIIYGMDSILSMLTLYLMLGPSGASLSLDRFLRRRKMDDAGLQTAPPPCVPASIVLRLIQIHLCIIYLASGLAKLQGATWWNGTAVYRAIMMPEVAPVDMGWMGMHDWMWILISTSGCIFTLITELSFPIFIWHHRLKPLVLASVILMQTGIAIILSLGSFQAAMFAATLAFFPADALRRLLDAPRCRVASAK